MYWTRDDDDDDDDEVPGMIVVCQGPPRCKLTGDAAFAAAQAGCIWCDRFALDLAGNEIKVGGPGHG